MENEEERWEREREEEEEEKMPSQKRTEKKKLRQARKRPRWISRGKFMSCHVFSQECSQVKAAFVPRLCVYELIYLGPHPCTRDIPRNGPTATQMR